MDLPSPETSPSLHHQAEKKALVEPLYGLQAVVWPLVLARFHVLIWFGFPAADGHRQEGGCHCQTLVVVQSLTGEGVFVVCDLAEPRPA